MSTFAALCVGLVLGRVVGGTLAAAWRESSRVLRARDLDELVRQVRREHASESAVRRTLAGRAWEER
jgi:hypothetical protein